VLAELNWEPSVTAAHIGVTAKAGVVALTGHVETYAEKHAAEMAVSRVKGVKAVAEEIEVRLPFETKRSDEDLAAAALSRLGWDGSVPRDAIKVKVEKGWVTLSGDVDWYYQKAAAQQDVRGLSGVVGVSDQVAIKPRADAAKIDASIEHALNRSWYWHPDTITVSAEGGRVKLRGTARSLHEKYLAASTAWAAPGVTGVENDITVV
jgi:osmotically-inducible protein OsmY